jgi:hypothetical protein
MNKAVITFATLIVVAIAGADQAVYTSKLENGWGDWSWAKVSKSGRTLSVASKAWQGLFFHHTDQKSSGFKSISFNVIATTKEPLKLFVHSVTSKGPSKEAFFVEAPTKKVLHVEVPIAKVGLTGQSFSGFWIQSEKMATYKVTDVSLKTK